MIEVEVCIKVDTIETRAVIYKKLSLSDAQVKRSPGDLVEINLQECTDDVLRAYKAVK
jgi:hypothetical protein